MRMEKEIIRDLKCDGKNAIIIDSILTANAILASNPNFSRGIRQLHIGILESHMIDIVKENPFDGEINDYHVVHAYMLHSVKPKTIEAMRFLLDDNFNIRLAHMYTNAVINTALLDMTWKSCFSDIDSQII